MKGKIKRIDDRGFGFIAPEEGEKDVFFHANDLTGININDLNPGDSVTFDIEDSPKGPKAINLATDPA